jgi:hypothetical protein
MQVTTPCSDYFLNVAPFLLPELIRNGQWSAVDRVFGFATTGAFADVVSAANRNLLCFVPFPAKRIHAAGWMLVPWQEAN